MYDYYYYVGTIDGCRLLAYTPSIFKICLSCKKVFNCFWIADISIALVIIVF